MRKYQMENNIGFIIPILVAVAIMNFHDIDKTTNLQQFWAPSLFQIHGSNFNLFKVLKTKSKSAHTAPKGKKRTPGDGNPWVYKDKLEPFPGAGKLTRTEVLQIECRDRYKIRTSVHVMDDQTANDELYRMFGEM